MKCPKCGYNSFDYLDSCKKCGKDLVEFKQRFGIKSVLFPGAVVGVAKAAEEDLLVEDAAEIAATAALGATAPASPKVAEPAEGDDFGFDFMGESSEEEDLSFDELFEEAPEDEDMEESLEAPKRGAAPAQTQESDFAFDLPDVDDELEDNFGFDADDQAADSPSSSKPKGSAEGPSAPFDGPESSVVGGTPALSVSAVISSAAATGVLAGGAVAVGGGIDQEEAEEEPAVGVAPPIAVALEDKPIPDQFDAAPKTDGEPGPVPASLGGRFASFVYDAVILTLVGFCFVVAAELSMSRETGPLPTLDTLIDLSIPYFLVLFFLTFGYFTLFHFLAGQTPGKMLTGLRVETSVGEPLVFSQAFLRSVGGLLQFLPLGLGYFLILFSDDGRGWNDRLADTRVVLVTEKK